MLACAVLALNAALYARILRRYRRGPH